MIIKQSPYLSPLEKPSLSGQSHQITENLEKIIGFLGQIFFLQKSKADANCSIIQYIGVFTLPLARTEHEHISWSGPEIP